MNTEIRSSKPAVDGICLRLRPAPWAVRVGCAIAFLTLWPLAGRAQSVTATVAVGISPQAAAVNPVTNKIYVANRGGTVTVIDGIANTTTTVAAGTTPNAVAVNPVTNKIYVANQISNNVTVIDGATNATTTVTAGTSPAPVAVNPVTNQIYVANSGSANVTVIDGATNTTKTVSTGTPVAVAVNPVTDRIYVVNNGNPGTVTVIDGATNSTLTVAAGTHPLAVGLNSVTNSIYVANANNPFSNSTLTVIDAGRRTRYANAGAVAPVVQSRSLSSRASRSTSAGVPLDLAPATRWPDSPLRCRRLAS